MMGGLFSVNELSIVTMACLSILPVFVMRTALCEPKADFPLRLCTQMRIVPLAVATCLLSGDQPSPSTELK